MNTAPTNPMTFRNGLAWAGTLLAFPAGAALAGGHAVRVLADPYDGGDVAAIAQPCRANAKDRASAHPVR